MEVLLSLTPGVSLYSPHPLLHHENCPMVGRVFVSARFD